MTNPILRRADFARDNNDSDDVRAVVASDFDDVAALSRLASDDLARPVACSAALAGADSMAVLAERFTSSLSALETATGLSWRRVARDRDDGVFEDLWVADDGCSVSLVDDSVLIDDESGALLGRTIAIDAFEVTTASAIVAHVRRVLPVVVEHWRGRA